MALTFNLYDEWREIVADPTRAAAISGTLKLAIVKSTYTPDQALDDFWNDVSANEVSGTGYTAGGNACASPTWTDGGAGGTLTFDASDPSAWAQNAAGFTDGRRFVLYYDTGVGSTSRLVGYSNDYGANISSVAGAVTVNFDAAGIYTCPR